MVLPKWYQIILRNVISSVRQEIIQNGFRIYQTRFISGSRTVFSATRYYDELGLTPKATQSDIKAAYYKLSMLYHPDKNKDSEVAVKKFRDISEAYEVLGNFRLRKLYDKGIIHTTGPQFQKPDFEGLAKEEEEDDPQTKFYRAHMQKSKVPSSGRTPIYDFDEWSRAHYGTSFERRKAAKAKHDRQKTQRDNGVHLHHKELFLFGLAILISGFITVVIYEAKYDSVSYDNNGSEKKS